MEPTFLVIGDIPSVKSNQKGRLSNIGVKINSNTIFNWKKHTDGLSGTTHHHCKATDRTIKFKRWKL